MNESPDDLVRIRRALISVFKKDGVVDLARRLERNGVVLLSTGGTAALLRSEGLKVIDVSDVTGFPEMMDGRVKTLHPRIHGGLLMRRDVPTHAAAAKEHGIEPIDLVVVNLYPFDEVIKRPGVTFADAIEMIDIGGPSMVRSAAKNHDHVTVLTDPSDYASFLENFERHDGAIGRADRLALAKRAFGRTSAYDAAIHAWLAKDEFLPERISLELTKKQDLRYGENPHQRGALYVGEAPGYANIAHSHCHSGKELSYNNYLDADAALNCVRSFREPAAVVIKHKNPCGAAVDGDLSQAFIGAYEGDPLSAYGGIVAFNRPVTEAVAKLIATKEKFFEVIVAPGYEPGVLELLQTGAKWGKNVRIIEVAGEVSPRAMNHGREFRHVTGGYLVQDVDASDDQTMKVASKRQPTAAETADLLFAWSICRHVTSNAIVFAKGRRLVAAGAGQMSRVDSVELAARKGGDRCGGAAMASDAFFPFADGIKAAAAAGITSVIHPGGSIRDDEVLAECDRLDLAVLLTGVRHFRH